MFIATIVAPNGVQLELGALSSATDALAGADCVVKAAAWLDLDVAADIPFTGDRLAARAALEAALPALDVIVQVNARRRRSFLIADMDSTMITVECIDELADYAGIKSEVAAITEASMRGELDFEASLRARVALLKGLPDHVIADCLRERVQITPGAKPLVQTLRANGGTAMLVSGGFTQFADVVGAGIGFDKVLANTLGIKSGELDGTVIGNIVDADTKRETLMAELQTRNLPISTSLAVGDGANDIPMIIEAGLGVAYHAKPKTEASAPARIRHGDLTVLLYALGYPRAEWVCA